MNREELFHRIMDRRSFLCVGLDPDPAKFPTHLSGKKDSIVEFCTGIIDATKDLCVAYKPNLAFFEQSGAEGWLALERVVAHIGKEHFVIADAKRGDIGNTATMYARAFFERLGADAVTVAPYMGKDSVVPFLDFPGKWAVVLALTSNSGSADFQLLEVASTTGKSNSKLYENVLTNVSSWGTTDNIMFVVGATHPASFKEIRKLIPDHFMLVPGVGAQGGDLEQVALAGMNDRCGLLINSSRQILYASAGADFREKAREEAEKLQAQMAQLLESRFK
jgi:orotidine-5'-phosphate decarboxylase